MGVYLQTDLIFKAHRHAADAEGADPMQLLMAAGGGAMGGAVQAFSLLALATSLIGTSTGKDYPPPPPSPLSPPRCPPAHPAVKIVRVVGAGCEVVVVLQTRP